MTPEELRSAISEFDRHTQRLRLRKVAAEHQSVLIEHDQNPEIMARIRDLPTPEQARTRVEEMLEPWRAGEQEWVALAIETRESATTPLLGIFALRLLSWPSRSFEIGYRLHPDYYRRGYTLEASRFMFDFLFEEAKAHKLVAYTTHDNLASQRLAQKLGMQLEGRLREHSQIDGRWFDEMVFGQLSSDPRPSQT